MKYVIASIKIIVLSLIVEIYYIFNKYEEAKEIDQLRNKVVKEYCK